jgi:hypothetical protein
LNPKRRPRERNRPRARLNPRSASASSEFALPAGPSAYAGVRGKTCVCAARGDVPAAKSEGCSSGTGRRSKRTGRSTGERFAPSESGCDVGADSCDELNRAV